MAKASGIELPIYEQNAQTAKRKHYVDFKKIKTLPAELTKEEQDNLEHNTITKQDIKPNSSKRLTYKNIKKTGESEENLPKPNQNGTKIALKKELKRYSKELELYLISSMWKFAYFSSKDEDDQDFTEKLYSDQYIASIVEQAYGEDGGRLADGMYEKMLMQQGLDFDKEFNSEDKSERSIEGVRLSQ